jgi:hypothetical protein
MDGPGLEVKVLTYNTYWWNLFRLKPGRGRSAGNLIKQHDTPNFDFMGFQECEDIRLVLTNAGLLNQYEVYQGEAALCMAFKKSLWVTLEQSEDMVAEDQKVPNQYFGKRFAQWARVKHLPTGTIVLFVNHHGPLPVNSGGLCGGIATANNLIRLMTTHGQPGDAIILVGDFNANPASQTISKLLSYGLTHVDHGNMCGGVDNIFTNGFQAIRSNNYGGGGSDHDALDSVLRLGGGAVAAVTPAVTPAVSPAVSPEAPAAKTTAETGSSTAGASCKGRSQVGQDCRTTMCCTDPGFECYQKNKYWAGCKKTGTCLPGAQPGDGDEPWTCTPIGLVVPDKAPVVVPDNAPGSPSPCAMEDASCKAEKCCSAAGQQCFEKDAGWAQCLPSCAQGIHATDLPPANTPWSCKVLEPES